jgi:hypothetical protein
MASTRNEKKSYWFSQHTHQQAYLTLYALSSALLHSKQPQKPLVMSVVAKKMNDRATFFDKCHCPTLGLWVKSNQAQPACKNGLGP